MPRAWSLIRSQPYYRAEAFERGLKAAGYEVRKDGPLGARGDVLLIWNRYWAVHEQATRFEREGGTVLVAENGYLGAGGSSPKFDVHPGGPKPHHYYALGLGYHNDATRIVPGGPERFAALGVELKPWRVTGDHVLILPQRSFGVPGRMMPSDWPDQAKRRIERQTRRPVRIRQHPGNDEPKKRPLAADLEGAHCAVVWSSTAGIHALAAGIPTFCDGPHWIMKGAGAGGSIDGPEMPDHLPHFERMAFGQWRIEEIETGFPFMWLLPQYGKTSADCKARFNDGQRFIGEPSLP